MEAETKPCDLKKVTGACYLFFLFFLKLYNFYLFIYLFIYGYVGSSFLCEGFL